METARVLLLLQFLGLIGVVYGRDVYTETLTLRRLNQEDILADFRFTIEAHGLGAEADYELWPRVADELTRRKGIDAFDFSLSQGVYRSDRWGALPDVSRPTGAAILARFQRANDSAGDDRIRWRRLVNGVSGAFCGSLADLAEAKQTHDAVVREAPKAIEKNAKNRGNDDGEGNIYYGQLARESLCTENLTPLRKMLPCKQTGLATLLDSTAHLYASDWHAVSLKVERTPENNKNWRFEFALLVIWNRPKLLQFSSGFSLAELFGRGLTSKCAVAERSRIFLDGKWPAPEGFEDSLIDIGGNGFRQLDVQKLEDLSAEKPLNFVVPDEKEAQVLAIERERISIYAYQGGTNQQSGLYRLSIRRLPGSRSAHRRLNATVSFFLPWWLKVKWSTLKLKCYNAETQQFVPRHLHIVQLSEARDRERPAILEANFELKSLQNGDQDDDCFVEVHFDKAFIRMDEFPPDANHGLYVPPATVLISENGGDDSAIRLHSNALLILMPVPDFSMPFNVICLVTTALALCYGPVHAFCTKLLIPVTIELPKPSLAKRAFRASLLLLIALAAYAQYQEIGLHEMKRWVLDRVHELQTGV